LRRKFFPPPPRRGFLVSLGAAFLCPAHPEEHFATVPEKQASSPASAAIVPVAETPSASSSTASSRRATHTTRLVQWAGWLFTSYKPKEKTFSFCACSIIEKRPPTKKEVVAEFGIR
jgi:hypothetical protein